MKYFGLTEKGFVRKRYLDIWEDMQKTARTVFGDDVNLQENSPLGMFLRLNAWEIATAWQMAEDVYFSAFVDFAEGHQLDLVCQYIGIRRTPAQHAQGTIRFTGTIGGTIIPKGTLVATAEGVQFETIEETFIAGDTATAKIQAVLPGEGGNLQAGTITELVNPISGVDNEVVNEAATAEGRPAESDYDLRVRYKRSVQNPGRATAGAIEAAIMDIPEVWDAYVRENDTNTPVVVGDVTIPVKSIYPIVHYGDDNDIANTIFENKAAGIQSYTPEDTGTIISVQDTRGINHSIGFDRPDEVWICIAVQVETDASFPVDGDEQIAELLKEYIDSRGISRDVIYTRLITIVQSFQGVTDVPELLLYIQAKANLQAASGAWVKVRAAFIDGFRGPQGNDIDISFTDTGSGGHSIEFDGYMITINFGGEETMTASELRELIDSLDQFGAIVKSVGYFTVAADIGLTATLADGSVTQCENVVIGMREVSIPSGIEVTVV